jgi:cobalt-precorrin 5A hydrolase
MSEALGIWLTRAQGERLGMSLQQHLGGTLYRPWLRQDAPRAQFVACFRTHRRWLMVAAAGIAVRFIDGLPQDKRSDPALVVIDEAGRFAVPLLCGHEGGGNALAYQAAAAIGAVPVVTTATEALKPLVLGIGCRRDATQWAIEAAAHKALGSRALGEVREVATIDLKANEPGLIAFCERHALPLRVMARDAVRARAWTIQPSAWVRQHVGVDGVCEPCALMACPRGALLVPKTTLDGVAVAVAEDKQWMLE